MDLPGISAPHILFACCCVSGRSRAGARSHQEGIDCPISSLADGVFNMSLVLGPPFDYTTHLLVAKLTPGLTPVLEVSFPPEEGYVFGRDVEPFLQLYIQVPPPALPSRCFLLFSSLLFLSSVLFVLSWYVVSWREAVQRCAALPARTSSARGGCLTTRCGCGCGSLISAR